jgi:hypothetical protein
VGACTLDRETGRITHGVKQSKEEGVCCWRGVLSFYPLRQCVRLMSAALALTEPSGLALGDPPGFVHSLSVPISRTGSRIITLSVFRFCRQLGSPRPRRVFGGLGGATRAGAALGHRQAACDARGNPHAGPREGLPPRRSLLSRLHSPVLAQNKQAEKTWRMMLVRPVPPCTLGPRTPDPTSHPRFRPAC